MTHINAINNLDKLISKVEFSRLQLNEHHIVQIVAVSKYSTSEDIKVLYEAGQRAFGENKIQDFKVKQEELKDLPISWHFIGTLQKNKINNLIDLNPVLFHSLDSLELAQELDKKLKAKNKFMNCLLQINSACEDTKSGVNPNEAKNIYKQIQEQCTNIKLKGVMSIGANSNDSALINKSFQTTKEIYDTLDNATICSMGMSSDYPSAIVHGSNMIRVGSVLFK
ncbi:MAG: YggS family pyridoxal phosphate-dependent enzyme [Campylobacterota bacterium]|nr:YggS family pyridoxal phosphate-dependent enzyme [Campylobacterota bacterium]